MEQVTTFTCETCGRTLLLAGNFKKTRWGSFAHVCNECATKKRMQTVNEMKNKMTKESHELRLADFTPRELMEGLARRGYEGKLTFTRVETIDITDF